MGAQQSQAASGTVSDIARNYSTLMDAMMTNQVGFASSMKDISDAEREWFSSFERYVSENKADVSSEDSLYRNIQAFTRLSGDDTEALLRQIADPGMRASADSVLKRTNKAVVLQKYYEYKYLHLSAVFMNFTEFVQKLFELMASASVQVAENQAVLTTKDVAELLDAMASVIPAQDAARIQKSVQAVHKSAHDRLRVMSKQLEKIIEVGREQIGEFPMKQLEQQREEGREQLQRAVDDAVGQTRGPPAPGAPRADAPAPGRFGDRRPPFQQGDSRPPRFGDRRPPFQPGEGPRPPRPPTGEPPRFGEGRPPFQPGDSRPPPRPPAGEGATPAKSPPSFGFDVPESSGPKPAPPGAPSKPFGFDSSDSDKGSEGAKDEGEKKEADGPGKGSSDEGDSSAPKDSEDKNESVERAEKVSEKRKIPDDAFMFGGAAFLQEAASELDAIVRGGGRMKAGRRGGGGKPARAGKPSRSGKPSKMK